MAYLINVGMKFSPGVAEKRFTCHIAFCTPIRQNDRRLRKGAAIGPSGRLMHLPLRGHRLVVSMSEAAAIFYDFWCLNREILERQKAVLRHISIVVA